MARKIYDTTQDVGTPPAGKYADLETKHEQVAAQVNTLIGPYTNGGLSGCTPIYYEFDVPDHATQNIDVVIPDKIDIVDAMIVKASANNGANANTLQLFNVTGAGNITDAMTMNGKNVGDQVRSVSRFPAQRSIAAGGTLRMIQTKAAGDAACTVCVWGILRP
jgi:hypothetical protein